MKQRRAGVIEPLDLAVIRILPTRIAAETTALPPRHCARARRDEVKKTATCGLNFGSPPSVNR
jgi:hypothetical protein